MPDDVTTEVVETETEQAVEETVPASRFAEVAKHKKAADARVKELEKKLTEFESRLEERDAQGLPELERERKAREKLEQRLQEAQQQIEQSQNAQVRAQRERLVLAAAAKARFDEPDDALRYPEHVNLDEIESMDDAERAVKKLAKARPKLLAAEEPKIPGQVLRDGRPPAPDSPRLPGTTQPGAATGLISKDAEADSVKDALDQFLKQRRGSGMTFGL